MTLRMKTPLLAPDSPLDTRARQVIAELFDREQRLMDTLPTDAADDPKRLERVLLTRGEMLAQPERIVLTLAKEAQTLDSVALDIARRRFQRVCLTGCGDSLAVMIAVRLLLEEMLGIPCEPMQALDLAYYGTSVIDAGTLVIALSASGATTRTVEAVMVARANGAKTLALANAATSPLAEAADWTIRVHADRLGWPTQSSTAAMAALCALATRIGAERGVSRAAALADALARVPDRMREVAASCDGPVRDIVGSLGPHRTFLFSGGGPAFAAAVFGATKTKECTPHHALAVNLEEFHHYNSVKSGDPLLIFAPTGPSVFRARDTAFEARRWGGRVIAVVDQDEDLLDADSHAVLRLPSIPEALSAFTHALPAQLFAWHVAMDGFRKAGMSLPDQAEDR